jgi:hypothetical protein
MRRSRLRRLGSSPSLTLYTADFTPVVNRRFKPRSWVRDIDPLHFSSPQLHTAAQKCRQLPDSIIPVWATTASQLGTRSLFTWAIAIVQCVAVGNRTESANRSNRNLFSSISLVFPPDGPSCRSLSIPTPKATKGRRPLAQGFSPGEKALLGEMPPS